MAEGNLGVTITENYPYGMVYKPKMSRPQAHVLFNTN